MQNNANQANAKNLKLSYSAGEMGWEGIAGVVEYLTPASQTGSVSRKRGLPSSNAVQVKFVRRQKRLSLRLCFRRNERWMRCSNVSPTSRRAEGKML